MSKDTSRLEQQNLSSTLLQTNPDLIRSLYQDMPGYSASSRERPGATPSGGSSNPEHLDFPNPYDVPGKNYGNEWDAAFQKNHPRRTAVLRSDDTLLSEIKNSAGELNGNYNQLRTTALGIRSLEEQDAKAHGGHITPEEKAALLKQEAALNSLIKTDHKGDGGGGAGGGGGSGGGGGGDGGDGGGGGGGGGGDVNNGSLKSIIDQNSKEKPVAYPAGVPTTDSWYNGKFEGSGSTPPEGYKAMTAWGIVYPEKGVQGDPSAKVDIKDMTTWGHLKTGGWVELQSEDTGLNGAHYDADFKGNKRIPWDKQDLAGGGYEVDSPDAPGPGYNDHFFLKRAGLNPDMFDNYVVTAQMKATKPDSGLIGSLGADWWQNMTAKWPHNHAMGGSNFVPLTTQYQTLAYTTATPEELEKDPPPGYTS